MDINNKRIAKNTLMLYFRMLLIMAVSLYTSRIVLEILGVVDFGVYNIVGGIVLMFGFLNNAMSLTTQRFLNYEMGKGNDKSINRVFCTSVILHLFIALAVFLLAETLGLWLLNTKLNIPIDRVDAANWVYQFVILSTMVTIMQVPYNASIIAYEKMNIYAYVSIIEVILKLLIVYLLAWIGFDKLKLYGILIFFITLLVAMIYRIYCIKRFKTCSFHWLWNKKIFKDILSQSSWTLIGTSSLIGQQQGTNILLNIFFGVTLNSASAIATQINAAITQFTTNFLTAVRPQVVKLYAADQKEKLFRLICESSLFSFYLIFIISLPILLKTADVLNIWLTDIPQYTVVFTRIILSISLMNSLTISIQIGMQATGRLKYYMIVTGVILMSSIPISYVVLKFGAQPYVVYCVNLFISVTVLFSRIYFVNRNVYFPISKFFQNTIFYSIRVVILSLAIVGIFSHYIQTHYLLSFIGFYLLSCFIVGISIYAVGLDLTHRIYINSIFKNIKNRFV